MVYHFSENLLLKQEWKIFQNFFWRLFTDISAYLLCDYLGRLTLNLGPEISQFNQIQLFIFFKKAKPKCSISATKHWSSKPKLHTHLSLCNYNPLLQSMLLLLNRLLQSILFLASLSLPTKTQCMIHSILWEVNIPLCG